MLKSRRKMGAVSLSSTAKPGTPHTRSGAKQVVITYFSATLVLRTVIAYLWYHDERSSIRISSSRPGCQDLALRLLKDFERSGSTHAYGEERRFARLLAGSASNCAQLPCA